MSEITICRKYTWEAAHHLKGVVPETHKCHRIHGHSYACEVMLTGPLKNGMVWGLEFDAIDGAALTLVGMLDHKCLNDIGGLEVPTIENLAGWFAKQMTWSLKVPIRVRIYEGPRSWAEASNEN